MVSGFSPFYSIFLTILNHVKPHGFQRQAEIAQAASEAERLQKEAAQHAEDATEAAAEKTEATEVRSKERKREKTGKQQLKVDPEGRVSRYFFWLKRV